MVYRLMKRMIENAIKDGTIADKKPGYMEKLGVFYATDQITAEQYNELVALMA